MRTEDGCIIQKCLDGEPEAFGVLVDKYKAGIYAFAYAKLRDFRDAQDVTQEVFERAYRDLHSLRRWESFHFWLYRIASTHCKKWIRSQSRQPDSEYIQDQDPKILEIPSLDAYQEDQMNESLEEALDLLSETYREVLMLHYFGGMTSDEMARAIGTSPTAIRMRLSRARAQLKREMMAMMDTAFEGQRLQASFTFRIVETIKRIKIHPGPRTAGLPWVVSLAAGVIIAILSAGSHLNLPNLALFQLSPAQTSEGKMVAVGEMPVDVLKISHIPVISSMQGDSDNNGPQSPNQHSAALMAPRGEEVEFPKEPAMHLGKGTLMGAAQGLEGSLAYSPDGRLIAAAGGMGVWLLNATDFTEVGLLKGHTSPVSSVAFSPDGKLLASAGWMDETVRLWDVETQERTAVFWRQAEFTGSVVFSPDGKLIASAGTSGDWGETTVRFLDVETRKEIAVIRGSGEWINTLAFSPDGKLLAAGTTDDVVRIWSVEEAKEIAVLEGHTRTVRSVFFSSDGSLLASGSDDSTIRLWSVEEKKEIALLEGHTGPVSCISLSPDGNLLASGSIDKTARLWDIAGRKEIEVLKEYDSRVWGVFFGPSGNRLAIGVGDSTVRMWDMVGQEETAMLEGYSNQVWDVEFSPDGKLLASGESGSTIRFWDVETGEEIAKLSGRPPVCFSPDGKLLASEGQNDTILLWDIETKKEIAVLQGPEDSVYSLSFSPNGKLLASGGGYKDCTIRLWDVEKRELIDVLEGHTQGVISVAFSPDGELLASGGGEGAEGERDSTVRLWDVKKGKETAILRGHTYVVCEVAFSPDGNILASGGYDGKIRLWDLAPIPPLMQRPDKPVLLTTLSPSYMDALCFSPDGRFLLSGERDNSIKIWDVDERKLLRVLSGHCWSVSSLSFSPDGEWLASGSYDGAVLLWDMDPGVPGQFVEPSDKLLGTWGKVKKTELLQNYPNPFNPETWIPYQLARDSSVVIKIHTPSGQLLRTLELGDKTAGIYTERTKAAHWDGRNEEGEPVASGVYFYTIQTDDGDYTTTKKMVVAR